MRLSTRETIDNQAIKILAPREAFSLLKTQIVANLAFYNTGVLIRTTAVLNLTGLRPVRFKKKQLLRGPVLILVIVEVTLCEQLAWRNRPVVSRLM